MLMQFLGTSLIIAVSSVIFSIAGTITYEKIFPESNKHPKAFKFASGYFLGAVLFLLFFRSLDFIISNAKLALVVSLMSELLIALINFKKLKPEAFKKYILFVLRQRKAVLLSLVFIAYFAALLWIGDQRSGSINSLGSQHTARYANIAIYIAQINRIPIIAQNYGESLLALIPFFLNFKCPYLAIALWRVISILAMLFTIYGLFQILGASRALAKIGTFILFFGNISLSCQHVHVVDSHNPLVYFGHVDTVIYLTTFLIFFVWLNYFCLEKNKIRFRFMLVPLIFGIAWNICAPQSIAICAVIMLWFFLFFLLFRKILCKNILVGLCIFMLSAAIGALQGGMFVPKARIEKVDIAGLMEAPKVQKIKIAIWPPYSYPSPVGIGKWNRGPTIDIVPCTQEEGRLKTKLVFLRDFICEKESNLWLSLRISFFPLLGIFLFALLVARNVFKQSILDINFFSRFAVITFVLGWIVAYCLSLGERKSELTRFLVPGHCLGMVSLVLVINAYLEKMKPIHKKMLWAASIILITAGPIINMTTIVVKNTTHLKDKISLMINTSTMVLDSE